MLWNYTDHDEVLMQMEEENRPIYEPQNVIIQKMKKEMEDKEKKNFTRRSQMFLNEIQNKRSSIMESKEINDIQKKIKEDKIKKNLAEKRRIISVMSGMSGLENNRKPPQLYNNENNVLITTTSSKLSKNSKKI